MAIVQALRLGEFPGFPGTLPQSRISSGHPIIIIHFNP